MSGPPSNPAVSLASPVVCLTLALAIASELARLPSVLGYTLGFPVSPFGAVPLTAVAAAGLHSLLRRPSLLGACFGSALALAAFVCFDLEVPRRRGLALAIGAAAAIEGGRIFVARCAARSVRRGLVGALTLTSLAAAGIYARITLDRLPLRGNLRPQHTELTAQPPRRAASDTRSVVLITMDTTRTAELGCYGGARPATPHIDRFAGTATRFTRAFSTSPFTAPSVASLLTGLLPVDHGSIASSPVLHPEAVTLAEHLYGSGFATAGFLDNPWLGTDFGLARGYEYLSRQTDLGEIEKWLQVRGRSPFLLHVHLFQPHGPYDLRADELDAMGGPRSPEAARSIGDSLSARRIRDGEVPGRSGLSPEEIQWAHEIYLSEVRAMDRWIGDFLALLERQGAIDSIIVALTADHGEEFGERGGMHHSHTLYGELVHVPLIIRAPGMGAGTRDDTVSLASLGPALAELAGVSAMAGVDGDLPRIWPEPSPRSGAQGNSPRPSLSMRCRHGGRHFLRATTERWALHIRLIPGREPLEMRLFDLTSDPGEARNVLRQFPAAASDLLAAPSVAQALAKLREVPIAPPLGSAQKLQPRTASDLRVLGYSK